MAVATASLPPAKSFFVDVDSDDSFLDKPRLVYRQKEGSLRPPFTDEEKQKLRTLSPNSKLKIPPPPDREEDGR